MDQPTGTPFELPQEYRTRVGAERDVFGAWAALDRQVTGVVRSRILSDVRIVVAYQAGGIVVVTAIGLGLGDDVLDGGGVLRGYLCR